MQIKEEIRIIIIYFLLGVSWILFSDKIMASVITDPEQYMLFQTYKGWFFVFLTAFIFYIIIHNAMKKLREQKKELIKNYQQLEADNEKFMALSEEIINTNQKLNKQKELRQTEIILSITNMLEIHDSYTQGHCRNVATLARDIARKLELSEEEIEKAYWSGILHDIGKVLIPKRILNKKGKLDNQEFEIIKKHPEWGYQTLIKSKTLNNIAEYVLHHHERWDGNGYPASLKGNQIPLIASILALADAWDAMSSSRPYRQALSEELALEQIKKNRGTQFCPQVCDVFLELKTGS